MKDKGTTDAICVVRQMQEKFRAKGKKLYFGFVDLEFRQLVPLLTNKNIALIMRGRLYSSCVRSSMLQVRPGLLGKKIRWHFSGER